MHDVIGFTPETRALRILLIDDDPVHLELTSGMLIQAGYEVYCALNCLEGALSMSYDIDCVVTAFHLRGLNGVDFIKRYQRVTRPRFILLTGDPDESIRQRALDAGAKCVLDKPASLTELVTAIEDICPDIPHRVPRLMAHQKTA